jgi:predicted dehydrogenase
MKTVAAGATILEKSPTNISRRSVITGAAQAGATLALAGYPFSAASAMPKKRAAANDRITLGLIGCGGMGSSDMHQLMGKPEIQVAALCDVDDARMEGDIEFVTRANGKKPDIYKDYRKMLERKDIDAIIVGTPDNWHALNLIHAVEAGKDAYCEKPISHDIVEARSMANAVKHYNKIVQVGTWQRSTHEFVSAIEFIRSGKLGKVVTTRAWRTDSQRMGHHTPQAIPKGFDYDMWVGPATYKEYIPEYTHGNWRWFLNFGCGMTGDWGVHMIDIVLLAMSKNTDLPMPVEISSVGGKLAWPDDDRTAPDTQISIFKFKDPDFILQWETGRDKMNKDGSGAEFVAEDGKVLTVWRGGWKVRDADGNELPKEEAPATNDHWQNWVDCLKSREQPRSNLASMAQTTIVCHLANAAQLAGETVRFDKAKMDIVGRAGKHTSSYHREYRKPWKLPIY